MKPLHLQISGLNSFIQTQDIDFERLSDGRLFCISGDTGSGKTTVLDALIFALYGESNRTSKNEELVNVNCKKAVISLKIEIESKIYTIVREIRKSGPVLSKLYDASGVTLKDKTGEVNDFIKEAIGLDKGQFTKVVVLQQGAFDVFLLDTRKNRTELVSKLFNLKKFDVAVAKMREERAKKETELEFVSSALAENQASQQSLDLLESEIKEKEKEIEKISAELVTIQNEYNQIQSEFLKFEAYQSTAKLIRENEESLKAIEKSLVDAIEQKAKAEEGLKQVELIEREISVLVAKKEKLIEGKGIAKELLSHKAEREKLLLEYQKAKSECEAHRQSIEKNRAREMEIRKVLDVYDNDVESVSRTITSKYHELLKEYSAQNEKRKQKEVLTAELQKAQARVERAKIEFEIVSKAENVAYCALNTAKERLQKSENEYEKATIINSVAHIQKGLKEGDKCPVCNGIIHSISPCASCEISAKEKDEAKAEMEKANARYNDCSKAKSVTVNELNNAQIDVEQKRLALEKIEKELSVAVTASDVEKLKEKSELATALVDVIKNVENGINGDKLYAQAMQTTKERGVLNKAKIDELTAFLTQSFSTCQENEIANLARSAEEQLKELTTKKEKIVSDFTSAKAKVESEINAKEKLVQTIERLKGGIVVARKVEKQDVEKAKLLYDEQCLRKENAQKQVSMSLGALGALKEKLAQKLALEKNKTAIEKKLDVLVELTNLCKGGALTDYVAETYIEDFTTIASERLLSLTSNQYELIYDDGEFYVKDFLSAGQVRSVKTLSGGERFLASLSLAIAISRATAKSKEYGFFFIDEGFGTLDAQSLNTVTQSLGALSQDTVVGIITHVKDLIERLPAVLEVVKDAENGSRCTIK